MRRLKGQTDDVKLVSIDLKMHSLFFHKLSGIFDTGEALQARLNMKILVAIEFTTIKCDRI